MRILICEDSALLREGLVRLLEYGGHEIVSNLKDASHVVSEVLKHQPDLCILDVRLPPTFTDEGIKTALAVRKFSPATAILVLSQYVEERYASEFIAAKSQAFGYLLKDRVADVADFMQAVAQIAAGGTVFDPEVISQLLTRNAENRKLAELTTREREVLVEIAEGRSNQAIAKKLFISPGSVEKHITSIMQKLEIPADSNGNRRVLAVLAYLEAANAK